MRAVVICCVALLSCAPALAAAGSWSDARGDVSASFFGKRLPVEGTCHDDRVDVTSIDVSSDAETTTFLVTLAGDSAPACGDVPMAGALRFQLTFGAWFEPGDTQHVAMMQTNGRDCFMEIELDGWLSQRFCDYTFEPHQLTLRFPTVQTGSDETGHESRLDVRTLHWPEGKLYVWVDDAPLVAAPKLVGVEFEDQATLTTPIFPA